MKCLSVLKIAMLFWVLSFSALAAPFSECRGFYDPTEHEATQLLEAVENWHSLEEALGVPYDHKRYVMWGLSPGKRTPHAVATIHGLYNSPRDFADLADVFTSKNLTTVMTRMPGHREADTSVMLKKIKWQDWLDGAEEDFALARRMGQKVILTGHSTGALLATWLAAKYPENVSGLILFSPAFGVAPLMRVGTRLMKWTGITAMKGGGQVISGRGGVEVIKAGVAFKRWIKKNEQDDPDFLAKRLAGIPIWMGNTELDGVIQQSKARQFIGHVKEINPQGRIREDFWVPLHFAVLHDSIAKHSNPKLPEIKASLLEFISRLNDRDKP